MKGFPGFERLHRGSWTGALIGQGASKKWIEIWRKRLNFLNQSNNLTAHDKDLKFSNNLIPRQWLESLELVSGSCHATSALPTADLPWGGQFTWGGEIDFNNGHLFRWGGNEFFEGTIAINGFSMVLLPLNHHHLMFFLWLTIDIDGFSMVSAKFWYDGQQWFWPVWKT